MGREMGSVKDGYDRKWQGGREKERTRKEDEGKEGKERLMRKIDEWRIRGGRGGEGKKEKEKRTKEEGKGEK